jgi:hypothetical protein
MKNKIHELIPSEIRLILETKYEKWIEFSEGGLGIYRLNYSKVRKNNIENFIKSLISIMAELGFYSETCADYFTSAHWRHISIENFNKRQLDRFLNKFKNCKKTQRNIIHYYI